MNPVLITSTTGSRQEAGKISRLLVEKKLAACVNVLGPVESTFFWEGKINVDTEYKLFIKSFEKKFSEIQKEIKENHSYSVPEISMIVIKDMQPDYLKWMHEVID